MNTSFTSRTIETERRETIRAILNAVRPLAAEYYRLTGKPLGVTGEIGEQLVADLLGLELAPARTAGYDALRRTSTGLERIQIKSRAFPDDGRLSRRMGDIRHGEACDVVILALLDNRALALREVWEAPFHAVAERLALGGSKARDRGALRLNEFMALGQRIWPDSPLEQAKSRS
jgi:hypothetical protein